MIVSALASRLVGDQQLELAMNLRDSVLIRRNAIGREDLAFFSEYLRQAEMTDSLVSNFDDPSVGEEVEWIVNKKVRDTQEVQLDDSATRKLDAIVGHGVRSFIDAFFGVSVRDWEPSHILHYGCGGHYTPHVDAESLCKDELGRDFWEKTLDRDLSVVYFLNDGFAGGELVFPDIELRIEPEAGMLVCFPSDHNYIHGVNPVISGHRYTIVTWMRVAGMPSVEEINRQAFESFTRTQPRAFKQPPRLRKGGSERLGL